MANTITQADANKSGLSLITAEATGATQNVHMFSIGGIKIGYGTGVPDTEVTAPKGSIYTDVNTGKVYINVDASTQWNQIETKSLTDAPDYCGQILQLDGKVYIGAYSAAGVAAGTVQMLTYTGTAGTEVTAAAPATTAYPVMTAVAPAIVAATTLAWFQIGGLCEALVEGTTDVAADDSLEVLNTETAWKKDGSARSTVSGAMAVDAVTDAGPALATVFLINEQHTIAAS